MVVPECCLISQHSGRADSLTYIKEQMPQALDVSCWHEPDHQRCPQFFRIGGLCEFPLMQVNAALPNFRF